MHAGAGAGAIGTRHGTLAGEKKSLGGDGRCRDGRRGGDADGCRHDTTPSPIFQSSSSLSCWTAVGLVGDMAGWCHRHPPIT